MDPVGSSRSLPAREGRSCERVCARCHVKTLDPKMLVSAIELKGRVPENERPRTELFLIVSLGTHPPQDRARTWQARLAVATLPAMSGFRRSGASRAGTSRQGAKKTAYRRPIAPITVDTVSRLEEQTETRRLAGL